MKKIREIKTFSNVLEAPGDIKGRWSSLFGNKNHIVLELGCGKGAYTISLAEMFPNDNFIGVDIKGARMWTGAKQALEKKLPNVAFLRIGIEFITDYFAENEVDEIWITFPDPYPKNRSIKKRLTSPGFLKMYEHILKEGGLVHLKTDDIKLFNYTVQVLKSEKIKIIKNITDIYSHKLDPVVEIKTEYELKHLEEGRKINYLSFSL